MQHLKAKYHQGMLPHQILAKRGPDLKFVVESKFKTVVPKSNQRLISKYADPVR